MRVQGSGKLAATRHQGPPRRCRTCRSRSRGMPTAWGDRRPHRDAPAPPRGACRRRRRPSQRPVPAWAGHAAGMRPAGGQSAPCRCGDRRAHRPPGLPRGRGGRGGSPRGSGAARRRGRRAGRRDRQATTTAVISRMTYQVSPKLTTMVGGVAGGLAQVPACRRRPVDADAVTSATGPVADDRDVARRRRRSWNRWSVPAGSRVRQVPHRPCGRRRCRPCRRRPSRRRPGCRRLARRRRARCRTSGPVGAR